MAWGALQAIGVRLYVISLLRTLLIFFLITANLFIIALLYYRCQSRVRLLPPLGLARPPAQPLLPINLLQCVTVQQRDCRLARGD